MSETVRVINVQYEDIHITLDISAKGLRHILDFLDRCVVEYSFEEEPEFHESASFTKDFAKNMDKLLEEVDNRP